MDRMYTSYFGRLRELTGEFPRAAFVSIAGKSPAWFGGLKYGKLAPHYGWWSEWKRLFGENPGSLESVSWYSGKYKELVLGKLDPRKTLDEIARLAGGRSPVFLLCYEKPGEFCHRRLAAEWLSEAGAETPEY